MFFFQAMIFFNSIFKSPSSKKLKYLILLKISKFNLFILKEISFELQIKKSLQET